MEDRSIFQKVVLGICLVAGVAAIAIFALQRNKPEQDPVPLIIWGSIEERAFYDVFSNAVFPADAALVTVEYYQVDEEKFDEVLLNQLAEGKGPDLLLVPHHSLFAHESKLLTIPYEVLPQRTFLDSFLIASEVLMLPEGVIGIPVAVDPLVMYWNRDVLSSSGRVNPPQNWEELPPLTHAITQVDATRSILMSAVPFGEYQNVDNAKALLSTLLLQAGTTIIDHNALGEPEVTLAFQNNLPLPPAEATLRFYTEYSDPSSSLYTWNRSLPSSRRAFLAGDLALYFGKASELDRVRAGNPNLNIDVAPVPQIKDSSRKAVYADVYAIGILKRSLYPNEAYATARALAGMQSVSRLSQLTGLAPARKDLIVVAQDNPLMQTVFDEAVLARSWYDINPSETNRIFKDMVENVTSGRLRISESVRRAGEELELLIGK